MATSSTIPLAYGQVTLDGLTYLEQYQLFVVDVQVDVPKQVFTGLRLTLPGTANFLLKGLTRDITMPGQPDSVDELFRFRLVNAEGSTWYFSSGLGVFDDRVIDTLCFGSGQFPFPVIPPVPVHASGSLVFELEDLGLRALVNYPYIIHLGFQGVHLIPMNGTPTGQAPLAYTGPLMYIQPPQATGT